MYNPLHLCYLATMYTGRLNIRINYSFGFGVDNFPLEGGFIATGPLEPAVA